MSSWLAAMMLAATSVSTVPVESGTVLILKHSNKVVAAWTDAEVTHVALAMREGDETWVYEATPGEVRRLPFREYCRELGELNHGKKTRVELWTMAPQRTWSAGEESSVRRYLDAQLGRRYSIKNYVRGKEGDGVHCAELTASALEQTGRYYFQRAYSHSPAALYKLLQRSYAPARPLAVSAVKPREPWCRRTWNRCASWADWCSWACYESWTFCW